MILMTMNDFDGGMSESHNVFINGKKYIICYKYFYKPKMFTVDKIIFIKGNKCIVCYKYFY